MGSSPWDKHEQKVLEDGLRYYPHDKHSNMGIYIRIAASLPKKTVRDVAHHLRQMQVSYCEKFNVFLRRNTGEFERWSFSLSSCDVHRQASTSAVRGVLW